MIQWTFVSKQSDESNQPKWNSLGSGTKLNRTYLQRVLKRNDFGDEQNNLLWDPHISWKGEWNIPYKGVETFP